MKQSSVYYIIRAMMGLSFHMMFTAAGLYRIDIAQLEVYQLILIGSALEIAIFVFEVPTGIVADLRSRKLSVIIGLYIIGLGILIEPLTPFFVVIFISQVVWGLGYTFVSGALDSWVSDETDEKLLEHTIITGSQIYKLMSVLGIVLAAVFGRYNIRIALYISASLFFVLGLISVYLMKETHFKKHSQNTPFLKRYLNQLTKGYSYIKNQRVLRVMFIIMIFYGLYSEGIDRTYELHILDGLGFRTLWEVSPIWVLSIVNATIAVIGYITLKVVKKHLKKTHFIYIWTASLTMMMVIGILLFAYMPNAYFALFGFIFFSFSREGTYPLLNAILLKNTPSRIKATVLSAFGQLDAIGQLISGGLMVAISLWVGMHGMYLFTAILLLVPIILLIRLKKIDRSAQMT